MSSMTFEEAMRHAALWSTEVETEARAKRMMPHYVFVEGDEKHREGYCTACESWVDCGKEAMNAVPRWVREDPYLDDSDVEYPFIPFQQMSEYEFDRRNSGRTLHNDTGHCPECGARVTFKNVGRGYRTLCDRRFFFRWYKSRISPNDTVVGVGYDVYCAWRDYDPYHPEVPISIEPRELCVIRYGSGGDRFVNVLKWCDMGGWDQRWEHRRECKSGWAPGATFQNAVQTVLDNDSFYEAIANTPFEKVLCELNVFGYCDAGSFYDRITVLERIARYPCIEYMVRLRYNTLAMAVIDRSTGGLINTRGKTARSVLRLTKDEWGEVKGKKLEVTMGMLKARAWCREHGVRMNMEMCGSLGGRGAWQQALEDALRIDPGASIVKAVKYCMRKNVAIYEWRDQLRTMNFLEMDINDKEWRYPKDFRRAHDILNGRMHAVIAEKEANRKTAERTEQNEKIEKRLKSGELDEYFFSANGLVLRPMMSAAEIILEGSAQGHCVGGYVNTYANGNDVLCVLRYENALNRPLYTVEFAKDGHLIQCRARKNGEGPMTQKERDAFWHLHSLMREELRAQKAREEKAKKKRKETTAA